MLSSFELFTGLLTVLSLVGVVLNTHQDRRCFYIWIVTNSAWAGVDFYKGIYAQGTMFLLYLGLSVWGLYKWRHKKQVKVEVEVEKPLAGVVV